MKQKNYFAILMLAGFVVVEMLSGCGSSTSGSTNTSPATVSVTGASQVRIGSTAQFSAVVSNASSSAVTWQVNNISGGNSSVGTITSTGLYTPPTSIPTSNTVTITAVSVASPTLSASASISILNPIPVITSALCNGYGTTGSSYLLDVQGSGFVANTTLTVNGSSLSTTLISSTELQAIYTLATASSDTVTVAVTNPDPGSSSASSSLTLQQATATAAARLLDQSSFGPTLDTIATVRKIGLSAYLDQQFSATQTTMADIPTVNPAGCSGGSFGCSESEWWDLALHANDQLRQRVAFAMSQIWVVSTNSVTGIYIPYYINTLAKDAFGNFRDLMQDVTLTPAMANMLNMANSGKPSSSTQIANENFARELMQLFTIGVYQMNSDGSYKLDSNGIKIPTYTESQIQGMARALTGWTYPGVNGTAATQFIYEPVAWSYPMNPIESQHDTGSKTILNDVVLSSGQTAEQDLSQLLDTVFSHPNVGPFICKQLIQHLVTSNPTSGYISRVAAVFADNGSGVRGDMKAVVKAILLDSEARANDVSPSAIDGGHLREPVLYMTNLLRAFGATSTDSSPSTNYTYVNLSYVTEPLGQRPMRAPSVFNYFSSFYTIPTTSINAPEFGLENSATTIARLSVADSFVNNKLSTMSVDLSATSTWGQLAASSPQQLVDTLNTLLMQGQMSSTMNSSIVNYVSSIANNPAMRVRVAIYLIITSSAYKMAQ